jgi:hypothetical protein
MQKVQESRDGRYVDCHVWTFTPGSFVEQLAELARLELCDFVIETVSPTAENQLEFYVSLRRLPRNLPQAEVAELRSGGILELADEYPVSDAARAGSERLAAESERHVAEVSRLRAELSGNVTAAETRVTELEEELARVKASERWRIGGLVAAPGAAVKRLFHR